MCLAQDGSSSEGVRFFRMSVSTIPFHPHLCVMTRSLCCLRRSQTSLFILPSVHTHSLIILTNDHCPIHVQGIGLAAWLGGTASQFLLRRKPAWKGKNERGTTRPPNLASKSPTTSGGKNASKGGPPRGSIPSGKKFRNPCQKCVTETFAHSSCNCWLSPECHRYKTKEG